MPQTRLLFAAILAFATLIAAAQKPVPCPAPPAILTSTQPNIFSEQQEQWLGDAMADMIERDYKPVQDPALNEYLAHITRRLLAALPPTAMQFRVLLVDSSDVNGFSLAGGRVYLTRKLVASAHSEDEVASVIAHEMGHILSHQFAIETTADFKRLLNITSVTDKADIYAKFQRLVTARMTDKHPSPGGDTDEKQNQADAIAVYATAAAGYRPQAYADFWNRMFFVDGKVGGPLSDFFGVTKPESRRLRAILKLVTALPPGCGASEDTAGADFDRWHALVVANQSASIDLNIKPIAEVVLTPPLRMDLERLRFSRDGKYVLAQDESSVFVLSREPYAPLFRFDAEKALPAEFSPDSQSIVFHTPGLHTEEWSIPDRKMLASHELLARYDCLQTKLSPDGRTIFCISFRQDDWQFDLALFDSASGSVLFQKKNFFRPTFDFMFRLALSKFSSAPVDLMPSSFAADGNIVLLGPSIDKLAFDLRTRAPIPIGGGLKSSISGAYAFVGNDKVLGVSILDRKYSGLFSFPDGRRLQAVPFGLADLESVTSGDYVLTNDIPDFAVGLADVNAARFVAASKTPSMDVSNGWMLNENPDGSVLLHKLADGNATTSDRIATLPLSPLGPKLSAVTSADHRYLALTTRTRAGVWDLATGRQLLLSRRFNAAVFAPDNTLYVEFPKFGKQDRGIAHISLSPVSSTYLPYKEDDTMHLASGKLQEWKHTGKKSVELIVHDVRDDSILWRRAYDAGEPDHTGNLIPGQTIFTFPLKSGFARDRIKAVPALAPQAAAIHNHDAGLLVQLVDNTTGDILHELVIEIPLAYEGIDGLNIVGDTLYLSSSGNRSTVYALSTGAQLRQFFGYVIAADPASGRICAVNRRDEAVVYDPEGRDLANYRMGSPLRFAAFQTTAKTSSQNPTAQLILLTADQKVRTLEIPASAQ